MSSTTATVELLPFAGTPPEADDPTCCKSNMCSYEYYLPPGADSSPPVAAGGALGTREGPVQHRCARGSAQLVDKSVDGRGHRVETAGDTSPEAAGNPAVTCTATAPRLWTEESRRTRMSTRRSSPTRPGNAARGAGPESDAPRGRCCAAGSAGDDVQGHRDAHLGVDPHRDGVSAQALDAAGQLDPAPVELRTTGGGDRG